MVGYLVFFLDYKDIKNGQDPNLDHPQYLFNKFGRYPQREN
jgi:hypothetical protein